MRLVDMSCKKIKNQYTIRVDNYKDNENTYRMMMMMNKNID